MYLIKSKMNNESKIKEIGLGLAVSLLIATPANSKVLPISNRLSLFNTQTNNLYNSIDNSEQQIYITSVDNISTLLYNLPQKGDAQKFPILTNQISPLTPILEEKLLTKKHHKKFPERLNNKLVRGTNNQNNQIPILELSELTTHLQSENALALPINDNTLTLLPPISEKRTLITRHKLLQKKLEVERLPSQSTENRDRKRQEFYLTLTEKNVNQKQQQSPKNFQDIEPFIPESIVQNQPQKILENFNLLARQNESSAIGENVVKQQNQIEQKLNQQASRIFRIDEIQKPLTIASALYQPDIVITNFSENIKIAQQIIQVRDIRINTTAEGIEIVLETLDGEKLQLRSSVDGNTLIADIPNAVLALPDTEEFSAENPIEGITNITAKTVDGNSIRVTIEGETDLPTAAIISTEEGLTLSVNPVTDEIEVVISATRTGRQEEDIPRSITVINREQIEGQGAVSASNNVSDILGRLVPGFGPPNPVSRRTNAQNMRGRRALILIDGVVQNSNYNQFSELDTIDPSAIERIEVIRGPSALYGSGGSGGIINIITREPTGLNFQQDAQVGINDSIGDETFPGNGISYNSAYSFSGNQGVFDWRVQASLDQINRLYDADGDIIPSGLDGARSLNFLTKLGVDLSENQKLAFNYNLFNNRQFPEFFTDPIVLEIPGVQKARARRISNIEYDEPPEQTNHNLSLTYNNDDIFFGSKLYTQFFFQRTNLVNGIADIRALLESEGFVVSPDLSVVFQTGIEQRKLGTRFQINTPITNSANLLWGFDYTNEENSTEEFVLDPIAFDEEREGNIRDRVNLVPPFNLDSLALFLEGNWDVSQKLILTGGLRYENVNIDAEDWTASSINGLLTEAAGRPLPEFEGGQTNESDIAFNFGILYKVSSNISLYSNFSQAFTIPGLNVLATFASQEVNVFDIENLLTPEKVDNYEIGVRGNWNSVQFTVAAYYNNTDQGQNTIPAEILNEVVRGPQRNYGVEATIDLQPANTWNLGGTFTWMEGDADLFTDDNRSFVPLSSLNVQPMKFTFYLENQTLPSWNNRLQLLYVTDRNRAFDEGTDDFRIAGYTTVDFISTLNTGFGKWQVGIENLLNREYFPVFSQTGDERNRFAAPGRSLSIRYFLNF